MKERNYECQVSWAEREIVSDSMRLIESVLERFGVLRPISLRHHLENPVLEFRLFDFAVTVLVHGGKSFLLLGDLGCRPACAELCFDFVKSDNAVVVSIAAFHEFLGGLGSLGFEISGHFLSLLKIKLQLGPSGV